MTKKTRLLILLFCVVCFLAVTPVLVAYSMGYRFDFEKKKIVETGGIYIRTFPAAEQITIDSKISTKPGIFSNAIFVQSLLPKDHTVSIKKNGYYDYFKTLSVQERAVSKLENITLFKKSLPFNFVAGEVNYFSITPNEQSIITAGEGAEIVTFNYFNLNKTDEPRKISIAGTGKILEIKWSENSAAALIKTQISGDIFYYLFDIANTAPSIARLPYLDKNSRRISFNPSDAQEIFYEENKTLYSLKNNKPKAVIKNLLAYTVSGNNILWLSSMGTLHESDALGVLLVTLTKENIAVSPDKKYKLLNVSGKIFLQENDSLFLFNRDAKVFENFSLPEGSYEILNSPDGKNLIFCGSGRIYLYSFEDKEYEKLFSGEKITNCQWLNNDYIIITSGSDIIISEIDYRGNINAITLPSAADISEGKTVDIINPKTFYIQQTGKLYISSSNTLAVSEKLTP